MEVDVSFLAELPEILREAYNLFYDDDFFEYRVIESYGGVNQVAVSRCPVPWVRPERCRRRADRPAAPERFHQDISKRH